MDTCKRYRGSTPSIIDMETDPIYWRDSYARKVDAEVIARSDEGFATDRTVFYPGGGGQPHDTGVARWGGSGHRIVRAYRDGSLVYHVAEDGLPEIGEKVELEIDWDRRYRIMRLHTSLHVISAVMYNRLGVLITGSQIYEDRARIDFPAEEMNKEYAMEIVEEANKLASKGYEVEVFFVSPEEALKMKHLFRVAEFSKYEKYMKGPLRVVKIGDIDIQFDGGTHVKNTREIGEIVFLKYESKGRRNRRIYISVSP